MDLFCDEMRLVPNERSLLFYISGGLGASVDGLTPDETAKWQKAIDEWLEARDPNDLVPLTSHDTGK